MMQPCGVIYSVLFMVILSPALVSTTWSGARALVEQEDAEFEQKKHRDEQDLHNEEQATNSTIAKLKKLSSLKKYMNIIVENLPISKERTEVSTLHPANSSSKPTARSMGRVPLLFVKEMRKASLTLDQNSNGEVNSEHENEDRLSIESPVVYNQQFLARVKNETRKKEVAGQVDILPAKRNKTTTITRQGNSTGNANKTREVELRAEIIEEKLPKTSTEQAHDVVGVNRSLTVKNLTSGVLKPSDIEKISSDIGKTKKVIRLHLKKPPVKATKRPEKHIVDKEREHIKMFFAKNNNIKTTKNGGTAEIQSGKPKVTVFGAPDIDLETSTPKEENIIENSSTVEYTKNVTPSQTEIANLQRLKAMKDYLKLARKDLNFRSIIPDEPSSPLPKRFNRMKMANHGK